MRTSPQLLAFILCSALLANAQGTSFSKVRYGGGAIPGEIDHESWNNQLTITSDLITFQLKDGRRIDIQASKVTGLSYGEEAYRRAEAQVIAFAILVSPVALLSLLSKGQLHFIGINYNDVGEKPAVLVLQGDKDNYRGILVALSGSTGQPVAITENDRKYVPTQVKTTATLGNGVQRIYIGPMGQSSEAGRFRVALGNELPKVGFAVVSNASEADAILTGDLTLRGEERGAAARVSVSLSTHDGVLLWAKEFEPRLYFGRSDTFELRAEDVAKDLRVEFPERIALTGKSDVPSADVSKAFQRKCPGFSITDDAATSSFRLVAIEHKHGILLDGGFDLTLSDNHGTTLRSVSRVAYLDAAVKQVCPALRQK